MTEHRDPPPLRTGPVAGDSPADPVPPADTARVRFLQKPGLPQLLVRNLFFGALTLGFYRFWAKTNLRRFLWASIAIDGEPLEYTGRARELLIGFLIVMAVFVPLSVGYSALQAMLLDSPQAAFILSLAYILAFYLLFNAAVWRARRYRLLRTLWRGIRAGQDGSTWVYMGKATLWLLLVPLSLGFALPWALADFARYRIEHTTWGQFRGQFSGTGRGLLLPWLLVMVLVVLPIVAGLAAAAAQVDWALVFTASDTRQARQAFQPAVAWIGDSIILSLLVMVPVYAWFTIRWQRWYVGHARLGPLRFSSDLRLRSLIGRGILLLVVVPLFVGAVIAIGATAVAATYMRIWVAVPVALVFVVIGWSGMRLLGMLVFYVPVMRKVVEAITVENLLAAAEARQSRQPDMKFGEGLADSFEIGIV